MGSKRAHAISNYIITITLESRGRGPLTSSGWSRFWYWKSVPSPLPPICQRWPFFPPSRPLAAASQQNTTFVSSSEAAFGRIVSLPKTRHMRATCHPLAKRHLLYTETKQAAVIRWAVSLESDFPDVLLAACVGYLLLPIQFNRGKGAFFVRCVSI